MTMPLFYKSHEKLNNERIIIKIKKRYKEEISNKLFIKMNFISESSSSSF